MQKKAQFYLVAAVVIIGVVATLATIYNSVPKSKEDNSLNFLAEEMKFEVSRTLDSAVFNSINETEKKARIDFLADFYSNSNPTTDFFMLYGDDIQYTLIEKSQNNYFTNVKLGNKTLITNQAFVRDNETITIDFSNDEKLSYELTPTQSTFFFLTKEKGGEKFIVT